MSMQTFLFESSLTDLYSSTIQAFPNTGLRQHATHPIRITNIRWTPFQGMRTLFVKGLAQSEGNEYNPIILFKRVNFNLNELKLAASDGVEYTMGKISLENTDVSVRCNCPDFRWRFSYYDHVDKSLYGTKPRKYVRVEGSNRPPANPLKLPGMCKHIIKLVEALQQARLFKES